MSRSESHAVSTPSLGEEIANAITHGIGAALSIAGLTALVIFAVLYGDGWRITSMSIYGGALVFLYLASTLYHSIQVRPAKQVLLVLDHIGIALLIAGTYTPVLLVKLRTPQGWTFFVLIWAMAAGVAVMKAFFAGRYTILSTTIYVLMGWLSLFLVKSMAETMGYGGFAWMAAGGIAYSVGIIPFMWERLPYNHAIWHLFVIAGSVCHYVAIARYVLPVG